MVVASSSFNELRRRENLPLGMRVAVGQRDFSKLEPLLEKHSPNLVGFSFDAAKPHECKPLIEDASEALVGSGKPKDIGSVVMFLASQNAKFVTGTTWIIDGGWLSY